MPNDKNLTLGTIFTGKMDQSLRNAFRSIENTVRSVNQTMGGYEKTQKKTTDTTKKHTKAVKDTKKGYSGLRSEVSLTLGAVERVRRAMKVSLAYLTAGTLIYGTINALKTGTQEIIEFDQAMQNIAAITGATTAELLLMKDAMIDVAERTKFSTTEIAGGIVLLGQAGFSAGEAFDAIGAAADLAAGTLTDLTTTTDLLTTTIRAFGLEAREAGRVADVMANAINKSKLTMDKIRTAFNYVGATAAQVGLTLEQTAASLALLANNGLRASTIGTGFRQVLARMISPNKKLRDSFDELNIEYDEINPKTQGFEKAMQNLAKVILNTDGVTVDMTKAFELFGLRGAQAVAVLAKEFSGTGYKQMIDKMFEVGSAQEMASIQAEGLSFKFKNLADRAKILAIAIGDLGVTAALRLFVDVLRSTVWALTESINFFNKLIFRSKALREEYQKSQEQYKRTAQSLESYIGALKSIIENVDKSSKVSVEHKAILERLIEAHPILADVVKDSSDSYEDFTKIVQAANEELARSLMMPIFEAMRNLDKINAEMVGVQIDIAKKQKLYSNIMKYSTTGDVKDLPGSLGIELQNVLMALGKLRDRENELKKEQASRLKEITDLTFDYGMSLKNNVKAVTAFIDGFVVTNRLTQNQADLLKKVLIPAMEKVNTEREKAADAKDLENRNKAIKESAKAELKFRSLLATLSEDKEEKIKLDHERNEARIKKWAEDEVDRLRRTGMKKVEAEQAIQEKLNQLYEANNQQKERRLKDLQRKEEKSLKILAEDFRDFIAGNITLQEFWKESSDKVAYAISDGLANALGEVISGAKNAKEAFEDMARSMLIWLAKLIIKQTILNALRNWFPSFFGIGHEGGVVGKEIEKKHTGGIIGGRNFASDEVPIIAKEDEVMFTKGQMNALGKRMGGDVTIINSFEGATFLDRKQMMESMSAVSAQIANIVVQQNASRVIVQDMKDDKQIRSYMRG